MLKSFTLKLLLVATLAAGVTVPVWAQSCQTREEIAPDVRSAVEAAAQKAFDEASRGDAAALRADAIPSLQSNFGDIAGAVKDNQAALAGAKPEIRTSFLLDTGPTPSADGQFYCGVFGARGMGANGAEFDIPNLPVGKYGIAIQDIVGSKGPYVLTTIFQDMSGWKVAGLPRAFGRGCGTRWFLVSGACPRIQDQGAGAQCLVLLPDVMEPDCSGAVHEHRDAVQGDAGVKLGPAQGRTRGWYSRGIQCQRQNLQHH